MSNSKQQQGQSLDERATRRLIKRATRNRNWGLVESLFLELGHMFEEKEATS